MTYNAIDVGDNGCLVEVTGRIEFPTASESKGLGLGLGLGLRSGKVISCLICTSLMIESLAILSVSA